MRTLPPKIRDVNGKLFYGTAYTAINEIGMLIRVILDNTSERFTRGDLVRITGTLMSTEEIEDTIFTLTAWDQQNQCTEER